MEEQRVEVSCSVNGQKVTAQVDSRLLLSDFLRHDLGLTGTHVGCEHGVCGACTVLVDGASVRSCLMFAVQADGSSLEDRGESCDGRGAAQSPPGGVPRGARPAVRVLYAGNSDVAAQLHCASPMRTPGRSWRRYRVICAGARGTLTFRAAIDRVLDGDAADESAEVPANETKATMR